MSSYLNREEREAVLLLIAARSAVEIAAGMNKLKTEEEFAQVIVNCLETWTNVVLERQPEDVKHSLYKTAAESRMRIVSRQSSTAINRHIMVPVEELTRLLVGVTMDCMGCIKEGREIKRCRRRRDLLACGCVPMPETDGECGFERGTEI